MDRLLIGILLRHEHTWPLAIRRIVFDHNAIENTSQDIPGEDVFVRHLIVAMVRYPYFRTLNQSTNIVEGYTHAEKFNLSAIGPATTQDRGLLDGERVSMQVCDWQTLKFIRASGFS
jgi:hypothetical protein